MDMNMGTVVALIKAMGGGADPAVIEAKVEEWLDAHPEATTTVQDGSITEQKLATSIAQKLGLISSLSDEIVVLKEWKNIPIVIDQTTVPMYGGGTGTYNNWKSTDYISCNKFLKLNITAWCYNASNVNITPISFYDEQYNYLSGISGAEGTPIVGSNSIYTGVVDVPANAKYFKLTSFSGTEARGKNQTQVKAQLYTNADYTYINRLNVVCIGDSLTEGDQGADPYASAQNITPYNYPYWMQKYVGCSVENQGKSGYTTANAWSNIVQRIDYTNKNTFIIMLGSNGGLTDTIDTDCPVNTPYADYAYTNTGCYCKIIEHIIAQTAGQAQIILCTPPHIGTIRGEKRTTTIQAAAVVRKIALRYSLPLIDMMNDSGFSDYNESVFQPVDGLHFTVDGYKRMGTYIGSRLIAMNAIQIADS